MNELQSLIAQWFAAVGEALPLGFAFTAGMATAANPCGFAMLPAHLSLYLGTSELDTEARISRDPADAASR